MLEGYRGHNVLYHFNRLFASRITSKKKTFLYFIHLKSKEILSAISGEFFFFFFFPKIVNNWWKRYSNTCYRLHPITGGHVPVTLGYISNSDPNLVGGR